MDCKTKTCHVTMDSGYDGLNEPNTIIVCQTCVKSLAGLCRNTMASTCKVIRIRTCSPKNEKVKPLSTVGIRLGLYISKFQWQASRGYIKNA